MATNKEADTSRPKQSHVFRLPFSTLSVGWRPFHRNRFGYKGAVHVSDLPCIIEFGTCDLISSIMETASTAAKATRRSTSMSLNESGRMRFKSHTPTRSQCASNDNADQDELRTTEGSVVRTITIAFLANAAASSIASSIWQLPTIMRLTYHHILMFAHIRFGQNEDIYLRDTMFIASLAYVFVCWRSPSLLRVNPAMRLVHLFSIIQVCSLILVCMCSLANTGRYLHGQYPT